jgi:hypothetical protein
MSVTVDPSNVPPDLFANHQDLVAAAQNDEPTADATAVTPDVSSPPLAAAHVDDEASSPPGGAMPVDPDLEPADIDVDVFDEAWDGFRDSDPQFEDEPEVSDSIDDEHEPQPMAEPELEPAADAAATQPLGIFTPSIPEPRTPPPAPAPAAGPNVSPSGPSRAVGPQLALRNVAGRVRAWRRTRRVLTALALIAIVVLAGSLGTHKPTAPVTSPAPVGRSAAAAPPAAPVRRPAAGTHRARARRSHREQRTHPHHRDRRHRRHAVRGFVVRRAVVGIPVRVGALTAPVPAPARLRSVALTPSTAPSEFRP